MNATTTIPTRIHPKRNLTIALMVTGVMLTAALVWTVIGHAVGSTSSPDPASTSFTRTHAEVIAGLSPEQLAATYGNVFDPPVVPLTLDEEMAFIRDGAQPRRVGAAPGNVSDAQAVQRVG